MIQKLKHSIVRLRWNQMLNCRTSVTELSYIQTEFPSLCSAAFIDRWFSPKCLKTAISHACQIHRTNEMYRKKYNRITTITPESDTTPHQHTLIHNGQRWIFFFLHITHRIAHFFPSDLLISIFFWSLEHINFAYPFNKKNDERK